MGTGLAVIPNNTTNRFDVLPSESDLGGFDGWKCEIIQSGSHDDTDHFVITDQQHSISTQTGNSVTVNVDGMNATGRSYNAILRISLLNDFTKYTDINLVQQSVSVDLSPNTFSAVPAVGGQTPLITVQTENVLLWSASITVNSGTAIDGRTLVNHAAKLVDENDIPIVPGTLYPVSKQFRVAFPKIYYPNRGIAISATVTVTVGSISKIITVNQSQLAIQTTMNVADLLTGYGTFAYGPGYWQSYYYGVTGGTYGGQTFPGIPGYSRTTSVGSATQYVHAGNSNMNATYDWPGVAGFVQNNDGLLVIMADMPGNIAGLNNTDSPLNVCGYVIGNAGGGAMTSTLNTAVSDTKIYQFLMDKGVNPITTITVDFGGDITSTRATTIPASAVPILIKSDGVRLAIDPLNKLIYCGDSQTFEGALLSGGRREFIDNLMYYVANAAKYGSHFTDMLRDDLDVPAPWDDVWSANKGVTK
jgi:hypothetical protein